MSPTVFENANLLLAHYLCKQSQEIRSTSLGSTGYYFFTAIPVKKNIKQFMLQFGGFMHER